MTRYTPQPFVGEISSVPLYLAQELERIAESIASVQGGGTLLREAGTAGLVRTCPADGSYVQIIDFDAAAPLRAPVGINIDVPGNAIHLRRGGLWGIGVTLDVTGLDTQRRYILRVFVDDQPTRLFALVDPSNQTAAHTFVFTGVYRISTEPYGDFKLDLRIAQLDVAAADFQVFGGYLCVWAIGD